MRLRDCRRVGACYDALVLDIDGVIHVEGAPIRHAVASLTEARASGLDLTFVTNNALHEASAVAHLLTDLGLVTDASQVVTSIDATVIALRQALPRGAPVAVLAGTALRDAVESAGFELVGLRDGVVRPAALVTSYDAATTWQDISTASVAISEGVRWFVVTPDRTIPTEHGIAPGHGMLVDVIASFSGAEPKVTGKPAAFTFEEAVRRSGALRPLVVGDRLDSDIEGANRSGMDSMLVLTGVTDLTALVSAPPTRRPTLIASDLRGLSEVHRRAREDGDFMRLGGWSARTRDGAIETSGEGTASDWWRVVAEVAWRHLDETGEPCDLEAERAPRPGGSDGGDEL